MLVLQSHCRRQSLLAKLLKPKCSRTYSQDSVTILVSNLLSPNKPGFPFDSKRSCATPRETSVFTTFSARSQAISNPMSETAFCPPAVWPSINNLLGTLASNFKPNVRDSLLSSGSVAFDQQPWLCYCF